MNVAQKDVRHGSGFYIDVSVDLDDIKLRLGSLSDKAPSVLTKALNDTAKWVSRELASSAQDRYRVQKTKFTKEFQIRRATKGRLVAALLSEGRALSASKFKISPTKPKVSLAGSPPAKLAIVKNKSPKTVPSDRGPLAFVTEFNSGHVAVVQREPPRKYKSKGWAERKAKWASFFQKRHKLDDTRIQELYGPSVPKMLEKTGVLEQFIGNNHPEILAHLQQEITKHINTELYFASKR